MDGKTYIGIDPGAKGFISAQRNGKWEHWSIEDNDLYQLSEILGRLRMENPNLTCVIEDVKAIHGCSAKSTFAFGFNKGYLIGLLSANKIPYTLVAPQVWQRAIWDSC